MRKEKIRKHLISYSFLFAEIIGLVGTAIPFDGGIGMLINLHDFADVISWLEIGIFFGLFLIYPFVLTVLNLFFLFYTKKDTEWNKKARQIEYLTVFLGVIFSGLANAISEIQFDADWQEVLVNDQMHTPIWTQAYPTVIVLSLVGIAGYLFLSCVHVNKVPPLAIVLGIASMYIGVTQCILWIVQMLENQLFNKGLYIYLYLYLCLFPFNCIVLAGSTIRRLVWEWQQEQEKKEIVYKNKTLQVINQKLMDSRKWPLFALVLMLPLLGILIGILVLCGQQPDAIIRAWTETSDWNLSQRVAPQNVYVDMHYLCTVAAGGHKNVVKPIRLGERHGHEVVVNRQLCVANAFEQILEEKTPRFHRHVRHFYDTYGFPIAKKIRSPYTADFVYFVMKPLEWFFLLVLYLTDTDPENRIALQYMPPKEKEKLQRAMNMKK